MISRGSIVRGRLQKQLDPIDPLAPKRFDQSCPTLQRAIELVFFISMYVKTTIPTILIVIIEGRRGDLGLT